MKKNKDLKNGRNIYLIDSPTGTGKTLAYLLPLV
jgi:Rad3-related DNA helicase